uniref:Type VI secretion system Vgr family protein n=1 Tax=uncultured Planctomycetota bacterium TaxID=120965 RepID=H5SCR9_9BACT|nr:type VI secretion system Vgr family protein [uncultured Planctomycetota bacterium]
MPSLTVSLPSLTELHEGEYVYLYPDVNHTPQCSSQPLTFSASGLPDGLSLDTSTGLITGLLPHSLANRTNPTREYTITLTATDGVDTASAPASLRIHNTDYTLLSPGDQSNTEGDYVYLDLQSLCGSAYAGLNTHAPLMFSTPTTPAPNSLPPGLSLDPNTGVISGIISYDAASVENSPYSYYVTLTLQNLADGDTSTISFNWAVIDNPNLAEPPPGDGNDPPPGDGSDDPSDGVHYYNAEGDFVNLYLGLLSDDNGWSLTYVVARAPAGVSVIYVDANDAGLDPIAYLQGTIAYSNVPSNEPPRDFHVAVTVTASTDPPQIHTYTFTWTIRDTNRIQELGPWFHREGDRVDTQVHAHDATGA